MIRRRLILSAAVAAGIAGVVASAPTSVAAQEVDPRYIEIAPPYQGGAVTEAWDIRAAEQRSSFTLFAEGDRAWTSLRMVGDNRIFETNSGPGDDRNLWSGGNPITQFSTEFGTIGQSFGIPLMMGAPRSEWVQYLVEGVDALRNAGGEGYTVMWNGAVFARPKDHNAADGLVGTLLSGARSTTDGSCLDHSAPLGGANMPAGFQLLPGSNCTPTWSPAGGWLGDRPISPDTWVEIFEEQGSDFRFDRWRVPAERKDASNFMGTNFATYGQFNDYNSTTLQKFGSVVPGGSGDPSRPGWPLGIDFVFDAFTFTLPSVANAKFWGGLMINNSEVLYGVQHDYDSLYIGIGPWPARFQDGDNYASPELGAWRSADSHTASDPECLKTDPIPLLGNFCGGFGANGRFRAGAHGIIVLKSPIGDLRNKLFTQTGSAFFQPTHPLAGDTITFNHAVNWNFGPWGSVWNQGTERMKFGVLSSTGENALDGRACSDYFDEFTRWSLFQDNDWPNSQCNFKAYVPGDWRYVSGRPASRDTFTAPDTLHLANCGPPGCPVAWADTTWQGWSANLFANLAQFSIGPFRLEAGDTTEVLIAMYSARDSTSFEAVTQAIVDFYLGLFAGPQAPPVVAIRDVDIGAGVTPGQDAEVRLFWDDAPEEWVDPFLLKFADDMDAAPDGTPTAILRDANPGLTDRIRARASDNVARLVLFKSCDGGSTFDGDGDCVGDPAVDESGNSIEPGWQAFGVLEADATGDFPNTFTDGNVTSGVRYLYVILGQSRGFSEVVVDDPNVTIEVVERTETIGTGDGTTAEFSGTLGFIPIEPGSVLITDGVQVVQDDGNGTLIGDTASSSDTTNVINYATGEFNVIFAAPPLLDAAITADYEQQVQTCGISPCQTTELVVAPPLLNPLSRSAADPNVLSVYVPASGAAGGRIAQVEFTNLDVPGKSSVPFEVQLASADARESTFQTWFGNQLTIVERSDSATGTLLSTAVHVQDVAQVVIEDTGTVVLNRVLGSRTLDREDGVAVTRPGATLVSDSFISGTPTIREQTFRIGPGELDPDFRFASAFALGEVVGGGTDTVPLLASGRVDGDAATPGSFIGRADFPGFTISADNTPATTFDTEFYLDENGDTLSLNLDPTLNVDQVTSNNTDLQGLTFGEYVITFEDSIFGSGSPFRLEFFDPAATEAEFDASVRNRRVATTGVADPATDSLVAAALQVDPDSIELIAGRFPFTVRNLTHGRPAELAMLDRGTARKTLGIAPDTLSVTVDPDIWMPFIDGVFVIETLDLFDTRRVAVGTDTVEAIVTGPDTVPVQTARRAVSFARLNLTCGGANPSCNPVRGPGFGQWIGVTPGDELHFKYFSPFVNNSVYEFVPRRSVQGQDILTQGRSIRDQMEQILVVPNPYIFFSAFEAASDQRRLMFTNLPPDGVLRIYTVSGQFVQEIDWAPSDLSGNGDLFWDLRTREGNEVGAGLYIFVVRATDPATGQGLKKMGKFVVIR